VGEEITGARSAERRSKPLERRNGDGGAQQQLRLREGERREEGWEASER
jgi:hypothetical protein